MRQLAFAVEGAINYKTCGEKKEKGLGHDLSSITRPDNYAFIPEERADSSKIREKEESCYEPTFSQKIMESQSNFGSMSLVKRRRRGEMLSPRIALMRV